MKMDMKYIFIFLILLIAEIIIAFFVKDAIIRPFIGDVLVIILIYTLIRGLMKKSIKLLPVYIFLFAFTVELAQYFNIVDALDLQKNKVISTIVGTTFDIKDILCYLVSTVILIIWNRIEKTSI
ncbi:MAG: DUF2809 domain-containing protein [Marinisporobacter sp.]|nr:DUF2809 domain-containing protein [Marinisporobacter sp.]